MIKIQRFQFYELVTALVLVLLFGFLLLTRPDPRVPRRASLSNCTGNVKQLGNACALYEGDNQGDRPGPQPWGQANPLISWDRPLAIQMGAGLKTDDPLASLTKKPPHASCKTLMTFTCPADPQGQGAKLEPASGSLADGTASGTGICRSYTLNLGSGNLAGKNDGIAATDKAVPVAKVESGAGTVSFIENQGYATVFGQRNLANDTTIVCTRDGKVIPVDAFTNAAVPMHGVKFRPRFNVLMYDGHVEVMEQACVTANGGEFMQYLKDEASAGEAAQ